MADGEAQNLLKSRSTQSSQHEKRKADRNISVLVNAGGHR